MNDGLAFLTFFLFMLYMIGVFAWVVSTSSDAKLLAPVWPLFWIKYVWRKLRE
jgi:hypothetical protein